MALGTTSTKTEQRRIGCASLVVRALDESEGPLPATHMKDKIWRSFPYRPNEIYLTLRWMRRLGLVSTFGTKKAAKYYLPDLAATLAPYIPPVWIVHRRRVIAGGTPLFPLHDFYPELQAA